MENYSVYEDIASRTNGDIYVGVVGPVRTGKSTFIKRFMEKLVIPSADPNARARMTDELPQSAAGKTVMTTEPKFVPNEAVQITVGKAATASVRLVDCVGFAVDGASGFTEDGKPRLVKTPWQEAPMPFSEAAAIGTQKVIREHSTIGVLVTTDGSITDLPRENYVQAEEKTVLELKEIGKPFVVLLNCKKPQKSEGLRAALEEKYGVSVVAVNAEEMTEGEIFQVMQKALFEFPLLSLDVKLPKWVQALPQENGLVCALLEKIKAVAPTLLKMKDCFALESVFGQEDKFNNPDSVKMDLGKGRAEIDLSVKDGVFYEVLSERCGESVCGEKELMEFVCTLVKGKREYDKVKSAFLSAQESGYGVVYPDSAEMDLEKPKLMKKGAGYGVRFKACADSYHIVRVDVSGDVSPIIGLKEQGESFLQSTLESYENEREKVWDTNIFGKSLKTLAYDELCKKSQAMPPELQQKMRRTLRRIVNEGKGGVLCILL
ncbi:MAG: stage IV sporulation protein A [Clostridia bacterium]|nr:stage IV sporulation protein A [Clostridia bacterium]